MRLKLVREETDIDFLGRRRIAAIGSAVAMALSLLALATMGLNFGIDFSGGSRIQLSFEQPPDFSDLRAALDASDLGDVTVQQFGADPTDVMLRIETQPDRNIQSDVIPQILEQVRDNVGDVALKGEQSVGAEVSGELIQTGVTAVILAVLAVLAYVWIRFEWQFSLGAVAALVHDVLITMGVFSLLQLEFNLYIVAALLTIVGYSLNDTVVVFDRIRENLRRYKTTPLSDVLNLSVNETLSRTVMTSATTLLALLALFFLGGPNLAGLPLAMIIGVIVGTYSSIFIAAPVLNALGVERNRDDGSSPAGVQFASGGS